MKLAGILWSVALAIVVAACDGSPYYVSDSIEAWVVDADTGQPIEGAIVTANWQLHSFGLDTGGRKLYQLEVMETVTDQKGRFYFPGFIRGNLTFAGLGNDDPRILIFKPGYDYSWMTSDYPGRPEDQGAHRHSKANGYTFKLKREPELRMYARHLDALESRLGSITERGYSKYIPKMILALNCEWIRVKRVDASILFSVPSMPAGEVMRCGNE